MTNINEQYVFGWYNKKDDTYHIKISDEKGVTRKNIEKCIKSLEDILPYKDQNLAGENIGQFNHCDGVCQFLNKFLYTDVKFYIAQQFMTGNVVYPVDHQLNKYTIWQKPLRWQYVEHCIAELKSILLMFNKGELNATS